jgi:hypothetical protein
VQLNEGKSTNNTELADILNMLEHLQVQVSAQEEELRHLRAQLKEKNSVTNLSKNDQVQPTSRRRMLKKLGATAVGLAITGTALAITTETASAAVDAGDNPINGSTAIVHPGAGFGSLPTMRVDATSTLAGGYITNTQSAALVATNSNSNQYGLIAVSGPSDVNSSELNVNFGSGAVAIRGASIQARAGSGSNTNGNLGIHGISDDQVGVLGQYQTITGVTGSYYINDQTTLIPAGVVGASDNGTGVIGASTSYAGIYAASSNTAGYSLIACRGQHDQNNQLVALNLAPLYIEPSTQVGTPPGSGHRKGEIHVDSNGRVWVCYADGSVTTPALTRVPPELRRSITAGVSSPGKFYQVSGIVYLSAPLRVVGPYNTVNSSFAITGPNPTYFKIEGTWTDNNPAPYTPVTDTIPPEATAIIGSISAVYPSNSGYATIFPANTGTPIAANLGYIAGTIAVNSFVMKLGAIPNGQPNAGTMGIAVLTSTQCPIAIDVVAYIM